MFPWRFSWRKVSPWADRHQLDEFIGLDDQIPGQLDLFELINIAFLDVDGDVNVFFVGGYGDLGGFDIEVDIAPIQIIRPQGFQVGLQLLLGILVIFGIETTAGWSC